MGAHLQMLSTAIPRRDRSTIEEDDEDDVISTYVEKQPTTIAEGQSHDRPRERNQVQRDIETPHSEHIMANESIEPKSTLVAKRSHRRSISGPIAFSNVASKIEVQDRPRTAPRSDSLVSVDSTPHTDATEFGWTGSTAPTTAPITPAWNSTRTSHVLHSGSANSSIAKFAAGDSEWMKHELEKYKKAQDEARAQQDLENQVIASISPDALRQAKPEQPSFPPSSVVRIPARKPLPRSSSDSARSTPGEQRTQCRPSTELSRSGSRRRRTPKSESGHELGMLRPESRQAKTDSRPPTGARQESGDIQIHFQPYAVPAAPRPSENVSQAGSRSRSLTRQLREYIRRGSRDRSQSASADISRPESRSRSIDTFNSSISSLAPSIDSTSSKWRRWRPFHRTQDSGDSNDISRPGSSSSSYRRHKRSREVAIPQDKKPPINLNRELPPLPSLDSWKPIELMEPVEPIVPADAVEPGPPKPLHIAAMYNGRTKSKRGRKPDEAVNSSRSQKPSVDSISSGQPRDSVLNEGRGVTSLDNSQSPPHIYKERPESFRLPPLPFDNPDGQAVSQDVSAQPPSDNQGHTVDFSRTTSFSTKSRFGRSVSYRVPTSSNTGTASNGATDQHSRTLSEQQLNFSRKLSSDDYVRMHDTRYQNAVEIKAKQPSRSKTAPQVTQDKPKKKKWWQSSSKQKKEKTWMDEVERVGSNSGMILTDETVGSPIARF